MSFTNEQKLIIIGLYESTKIPDIAKKIRAKPKNVYNWLEYRKLKKRPRWGETEVYLVENFGVQSKPFVNKSVNAIRIKKSRLSKKKVM